MKTKVYTLAEVIKIEEAALARGAKMATNRTINIMNACTAHTLMDKNDFTPEKLRRFMEDNGSLYDAVIAGYVSFEDLMKSCEDEYNIEFVEE